jgi:hypothetical protein
MYLARVRPWVQTPIPSKNKGRREEREGSRGGSEPLLSSPLLLTFPTLLCHLALPPSSGLSRTPQSTRFSSLDSFFRHLLRHLLMTSCLQRLRFNSWRNRIDHPTCGAQAHSKMQTCELHLLSNPVCSISGSLLGQPSQQDPGCCLSSVEVVGGRDVGSCDGTY